MLLDLVLWSFMIALVPLALGLAWQPTAAAVRGLGLTLRGPSECPNDRSVPPSRS